jgi:hypothetical protein
MRLLTIIKIEIMLNLILFLMLLTGLRALYTIFDYEIQCFMYDIYVKFFTKRKKRKL